MLEATIRSARPDDLDILWDFLAIATYESGARMAKAIPSVAKYLVGWQRPGDFGFIAEHENEIVGAAWARCFSTEELDFPFGEEGTPTVAIGVKSHGRGQGVGAQLMRELIGESARRGLGLCLSVRSENPARRLYERLGFRMVPNSIITNRTGGTSVGMVFDRPGVVS